MLERLEYGPCDGEGCPGCPAAGLSLEKRRLIETELGLVGVNISQAEKVIDIEAEAANGDSPYGRVLLDPGDSIRLAQATQTIADGDCVHHELVTE